MSRSRAIGVKSLPRVIRSCYEAYEWKHACAILKNDFPEEWNNIIEVLTHFRFRRSEVIKGGGGKSSIAKKIDVAFRQKGWVEKRFHTKMVIDSKELENPTHEIDCYKNRVALELEWNNKDPFFDRDLNNFRVLFDLRAISIGVIITRCDELQAIFNQLGIGAKYGPTTTHMKKLLPRIQGGGGGGCPVLVFGIKKRLYLENE